MSNKAPIGQQIPTINPNSGPNQLSFDLNRIDAFATSLGISFEHWKCVPSPLGLKGRGEYRKDQDGVDTITSNGNMYFASGCFTATMSDNSRDRKRVDEGLLDPSQGRLIMPRFYDKNGVLDPSNRIYLSIGDRIYLSDKDADTRVTNQQQMEYEEGVDNIPQFPIWEMDKHVPLIDSLGISYKQGTDYCITKDGNIRWLSGGKCPGIDPTTGKGRVYSIRYMYRAYWYVISLPKEVRITNITQGGVRTPQRLPEHAVIVREYVFHNQNRGNGQDTPKTKTPEREVAPVPETLNVTGESVNIDMANFIDPNEEIV